MEKRPHVSKKEISRFFGVGYDSVRNWGIAYGIHDIRAGGLDIVSLVFALLNVARQASCKPTVRNQARQLWHLFRLHGVRAGLRKATIENVVLPIDSKFSGKLYDPPPRYSAEELKEIKASDGEDGEMEMPLLISKPVFSPEGVDLEAQGLSQALQRVRFMELEAFKSFRRCVVHQDVSGMAFAHKSYTEVLDLLRKTEEGFLKVEEAKRRTLPVDEFRKWLVPILSELRQTLLSFDGMVGPKLVGRDLADVRKILREEMGKICERIREPAFDSGGDMEGGAKAAVDSESVAVGGK